MESLRALGIPLDDLLEKIGSLVQVLDVQGHVLYANAHWLDVLGYTPDELPELRFFDHVLHPIERGQTLMMLDRLHEGEELAHVVLALMTRRETPIVVEGSLIPHIVDDELKYIIGVLRDVTSHTETETELERLFNLSGDMLGVLDFDSIFLKLNPAWVDALGYGAEEMMGASLLDFVHEADQAALLYEMQKLAGGERTALFENRFRTKNGSYRWLSWSAAPYTDTQRIYFSARDTTARRQSEEMLHRVNEQLRAILNNSAALIYLKDAQGHYMLVNPAFESVFGVQQAQIIGQRDEQVFDPQIAEAIRENDQRILDKRAPAQFEETLPTADMPHTFLSTKFPLMDSDGRPYAICAVSTDITYRKLTEMQLSLRNQAIEASPTGISIADATLPDMPLIYVNPAFEKQTGYSAIDAIGRNCRFLQAHDRDQPPLADIRRALSQREPVTVVLRNYRKNGTMFYSELSLAPIFDDDGYLTHYVGISTDVTKRVEAEAKIQAQNQALIKGNRALVAARKQAEDATRLKSQFLATMSHELRTPLNAIIGYTEIQLAGMAGDMNEEQVDYQQRVLANAEHLLELINDVLDIAKIEAGRMEMVNKPFNLRDWLDEVVAQVRGLAEEKGIELVTQLDERMPPVIYGDPARVKQITINLLSNGIKFTHEGNVRVQIRRHGHDAWKLIVSDTGIGIPSHMLETIFEEFRQIDNTSQREQGGTGLGLSIVRKLVLMMGGNIRVSSQVGRGSSFMIILPLVKQDINERSLVGEYDDQS
jgi:PAS domain S-box-containing protein